MPRDTTKQTFLVATTLCLVCSVLVSAAAVILRPTQQRQKKLDIQRNILRVAGIDDKERSVAAQFQKNVEPVLIQLGETTQPRIEEPSEEGIDLDTYDPRKAAKTKYDSVEVSPPGALPQIARREIFTIAYKIRKEDGSLDQVVLPVYGKGLWSTLYGFIAVDADGVTVRGITFYEHGETPGLGGEVDNPAWKSLWPGKKLFDEKDLRNATFDNLPEPEVEVIKGSVEPDTPEAEHKVDGLSGATITSNGVTRFLQYWMGPDGFGAYLHKIRQESGSNPAAASSSKDGGDNG